VGISPRTPLAGGVREGGVPPSREQRLGSQQRLLPRHSGSQLRAGASSMLLRLFQAGLLLLLLVTTYAAVVDDSIIARRVLLSDAAVAASGARALDGSPPLYYFANATSASSMRKFRESERPRGLG
jgi:hypothetical protein